MDNCLDEKEKLSNREILPFFYQGLSTHQKRLIVDLELEDPFEIAHILDKIKLLAQEIGLNLNEQFNKISLNKWERTPSRDKTFKPQRKLFPRNLEKKDKTNFIFEKPDNKVKRLILLGKVNGKTSKILLDTGSERSYANPKIIPNTLLQRHLSKKGIEMANGSIHEIKEKAIIIL